MNESVSGTGTTSSTLTSRKGRFLPRNHRRVLRNTGISRVSAAMVRPSKMLSQLSMSTTAAYSSPDTGAGSGCAGFASNENQ
jgi:hypothetical protein